MMIKGLYEAHLPVNDLKASIAFYEKLELTLAHENERVAFLWIEKGKSWLGLWKVDINDNDFPYHPSTRHVAFQITTSSIEQIKAWLVEKGIGIHPMFGFSEENQPLVLDNPPQFHAAIYFLDPDGNLLECIAPLELDTDEDYDIMTYEDWDRKKNPFID
ncbi:VOC family protein [Bacillus altitudinis]|uniref:VOC family protein n=1 Tax=Bacillus pumilus TaxID=1408 RepID=UPI0025A11E3F|nr:VOC family protein [Bacillus pumilus]MDM5320073.1 VOC family protein [Bacillus pumilus]MDR4996507.1 VOC family protein [Bacillus altitudinis]